MAGKDTLGGRYDTCINFRRYSVLFGNVAFILSTSIFFTAFQNVGSPRSSWTQQHKDGPFASKLWWGTMWAPRKELEDPLRVRIKSPLSIPKHRGIHVFEVLGGSKAQAELGGQAGSVVTDLVTEGRHWSNTGSRSKDGLGPACSPDSGKWWCRPELPVPEDPLENSATSLVLTETQAYRGQLSLSAFSLILNQNLGCFFLLFQGAAPPAFLLLPQKSPPGLSPWAQPQHWASSQALPPVQVYSPLLMGRDKEPLVKE